MEKDHDYFVYAYRGFHGLTLRRVPAVDAVKLFPAVRSALAIQSATHDEPNEVDDAFRQWNTIPEPRDQTAEAFLRLLSECWNAELLRRSKTGPPFKYVASAHAVVEKSHLYWATALFEVFLFATLAFLLLYPFMRRYSFRRTLLCWTLTPIVFFAPYFLGFAAYTNAIWGPSGGIVYPQLLLHAGRLRGTEWEYHLWVALPELLTPLSQNPGGPVLSYSYTPTPGPLLALLYSLAGLTAALLIHTLRRYLLGTPTPRSHFEIILPEHPNN